MHFGAPERGVFPLVSMLGDLCPLVVGAALAFKRRREPRVALTFWGDGAMSTGDVHEGLNLAAVLKVPAVFVLQSNGYAYSTPTSRQMVNPCMADRVEGGWGIPATRVDGSDAIATLVALRGAIEEARAGGGPRAVEAVTLRLDGHAAHDDGSYMDQEQLRRLRRAARSRRAPGGAAAPRRPLGGRDRRRCARPRPTRSRAGLERGRSVAGARPGDDPRRRLRDEADVSDAAAHRRARARVRARRRDPGRGARRGRRGTAPRPRCARSCRRRRAPPGLFAPHVGTAFGGLGLDVRGQAPVFEEAGYSLLGPLALNCSAPDEGNMHLLEAVASPRAAGALPAAAGRRRGALGVRHDRAGARRGLRSDDAADDRAARRRRLGDRRAQAPDHRRRGLRVLHLHGAHRRRDPPRRGRDDVPRADATTRACASSA